MDCWTAKSWEPYTTGGVYNEKTDLIFSVADSNILRSFSQADKPPVKHKFIEPVYKLLTVNKETFLIFKSGYIQQLDSAIASKKSEKPKIISNGEEIVDCYMFNYDRAFIITKQTDISRANDNILVKIYVITISFSDDMMQENVTENQSFEISNQDAKLISLCVTPDHNLLTLWSNGEFCKAVFNFGSKIFSPIPGSVILSTTCIKTNKAAKIISLSNMHAAVLGMDISNEG